MSLTRIISLTEILELAGDTPAEGILSILGKVAYKAKEGQMDIDAKPEDIDKLYQRFQSNEEVERTFSYLFVKAGDERKAADSYSKLILFLEQRGAYGMAGDAAMEADKLFGGTLLFRVKAEQLYQQQIKRMDEERSKGEEINLFYYDQMLRKAGQMDKLRLRIQSRLTDYLSRGKFDLAACMCDMLERPEEAMRYRKLDQILK